MANATKDNERAVIGDNSGVAGEELKQFVERVERLEEEKAGLQGDIKEVFAEIKGRGFDAKIVRKVIARRKMDREERAEMDAMLKLYEQSLGIFG